MNKVELRLLQLLIVIFFGSTIWAAAPLPSQRGMFESFGYSNANGYGSSKKRALHIALAQEDALLKAMSLCDSGVEQVTRFTDFVDSDPFYIRVTSWAEFNCLQKLEPHPDESCIQQCGRGCLEKPIFCGEW